MTHPSDYDGGQLTESASSRNADYSFHDVNLNADYEPEPTLADLCLWGKPGRNCRCGFCQEMVARGRFGGERI